MGRIILGVWALLIAGTIASTPFAAEPADWPRRPVRFIVSAAAGSAGDTVCRIVGQRLGQRVKQTFVIDNRPAAAGTVAGEGLAHSTPDGYTIGLVTTSTHAIAVILNPKLSYDPVKDFAPLSMIGSAPYVLAVYPGLPVKSVADLIALAKSKPRQVNNGVFGTTSLGHLAGVLFSQLAGIELNAVAYRSSALAAIDVVAGRIEMQFSTLVPAVPFIRDGRLRALATTGAKRVSTLPDVPTLAESGLSGYEVLLWMGIAAPAAVTRSFVSRVNREMSEILSSPEVREALLQQGMEAEPGAPEILAGRIRSDVEKWRAVIAKAGIKTP